MDGTALVEHRMHRFQGPLLRISRAANVCGAGLLAALVLCAPARAETFSADQKAEIGSIVRSYLLENPEILRDVSAGTRSQGQGGGSRQARERA